MTNFTDSHVLQGAFVANQLRRLVDLIALQGDDLLQDAGITIPSRAVSCVLLVGDKGPVSTADIAKALAQPHQLTTQRVDVLVDLGLLKRVGDPKDRRRKILILTPKGEDQYKRVNARLVEAEKAFEGLFAEIGWDLSEIAGKALNALDQTPLLQRIQDEALQKPITATQNLEKGSK